MHPYVCSYLINYSLSFSFMIVATVGLMDVNYAVREDGGEISICVAVADETRADISFTVGFSTTDGTAGICTCLSQVLVLLLICF